MFKKQEMQLILFHKPYNLFNIIDVLKLHVIIIRRNKFISTHIYTYTEVFYSLFL
jgi:hypothetical protein